MRLFLILVPLVAAAQSPGQRPIMTGWFDSLNVGVQKMTVEAILDVRKAYGSEFTIGSDFASMKEYFTCLDGEPPPQDRSPEALRAWAQRTRGVKPNCDNVGINHLGSAEMATIEEAGRLCRSAQKTEDQQSKCRMLFNGVPLGFLTEGKVKSATSACWNKPIKVLAEQQKSGKYEGLKVPGGLSAKIVPCSDSSRHQVERTRADWIRNDMLMGYCLQYYGNVPDPGGPFYAGAVGLSADGFPTAFESYDPTQNSFPNFEYLDEVKEIFQANGGKSSLNPVTAQSYNILFNLRAPLERAPEGAKPIISALKNLIKDAQTKLQCPAFLDEWVNPETITSRNPIPTRRGSPARPGQPTRPTNGSN